MSPVVRWLVIANVAVFGLQNVVADGLLTRFALWPLGRHFAQGVGMVGFEPWQLITSAFLHGGLTHIFFNMFALYSFGIVVERQLGSNRFAGLYLASVLSAGLMQLATVTLTVDQGAVPTVGASGGVFGVMLAFAILNPQARVLLVFPPIPMKAWVLVTGYAIVELSSGIFGTTQGVAHFAHLGGMLGAGALLMYWRFRMPDERRD